MSHSTVSNPSVPTKKTHPTMVQRIRKLHVTVHECKGDSPGGVKERSHEVYMCMYKQLSVGMCLPSSHHSAADSYFCSYALSEKKVLQWFFRMVKGSTWNLLLPEPG